MARLEFTLEIAAPPDRVFLFFVPQRMPYWYGAEMEMQFEVQGGAPDFAAGQKVRLAGRLAGRDVTLTAVVTAYEWQRRLEWQFRDAYGVRGTQRWELEPAPGGATRLTMVDDYELPGRLGKVFDALVTRRAVRRRDLRWLAKLQQLAERQPRE
jgi:uncharacterized protein YndB with AHSA1/START domain